MLQKSYTFLNEEITAIHREGYYLWVATTPTTGNAKLYKLSVENPEVIYYTITTEFLIVNKIVSGGDYIYITGEWTNYVYSKYSKTAPLVDYYHIDTEVGYEALQGNDLTFDTSHSMIHILYSGNESLQSPVLFTYDENDELYNTLDMTESSTIISNTNGMVKDEYNDYLYLFASYNGIVKLVQINIVNSFLLLTYDLISESNISLTPVSDIIVSHTEVGGNGVIIYISTEEGNIITADVTDPNFIVTDSHLTSNLLTTRTNRLFYNSIEDNIYFTGTPNTSIYYSNAMQQSLQFINISEFYNTQNVLTLLDGYSEYGLLFAVSGTSLIVLDNSTRKVIDTDLRIMFQKTKTILTNLFMIQTKKVNTDFRTKGIETKLVYTDLRYRV